MASEGDTILFLERNRISVYDANNVLKLDVPDTVVRDIDILDKTGFDGLVDGFIKTKKLDAGRLWIVLSDEVCFSQDIADTDPSKLETDVRDFLETIPFDQIISKRFKAQTGVRVIATNLELVEAVIEIFERNGFATEVVTPTAIFPGYSTKKELDPALARFVLANKSLATQGNMLAKINAPKPVAEAPKEAKPKNKLLPYLLVGFFILLVVLVATLLLRK